MKKLFSLDSPIMRFLSHLADLVILSFLWLVCSLPLVTMGAATTALYAVLLKDVAGEGGPVVRSFFRYFKENFKQATVLWLILAVVTAICVADVLLILSGMVGESIAAIVVCSVPLVFVVMAMGYCYPMIAYFRITTGRTLKNALLLTVCKLPSSLLMAALNCFPMALWVFFPKQFYATVIFLLLIGPGIIANLNAYLLLRIFKKIPEA